MSNEISNQKFRWFIFFSVFFSIVTSTILMIGPSALSIPLAAELGMSVAPVTGILMGVNVIATCISSMVCGSLSDKFGLAPTLIVSNIFMILGSVLMLVFSGSFAALIVLRFIQGLGFGAAALIAVVSAVWFPQKQRAMVNGLGAVGVTGGIAIGFIIIPKMYVAIQSATVTFAYLGIFAVIALLLSFGLLAGPKVAKLGADAAQHLSNAVAHDFRLALKQPATYIGFFACFLMSWTLQGFNDLTPAYIGLEAPLGVGYGIVNAGSFMSMVQLGSIAAGLLVGVILSKVFRGNIRWYLIITFLLIAVAAIGIKMPFVYSNYGLLMVALVLVGFGQGPVVALILTFSAMHYPHHIAGKLGGIFSGLSFTGGFFGVTIGATLLHTTGNYTASIITVSIIAIIGAVVSSLLRVPKAFIKS